MQTLMVYAIGIAARILGGFSSPAGCRSDCGTLTLLFAMLQRAEMRTVAGRVTAADRIASALEYYRHGHVNSLCATVRLRVPYLSFHSMPAIFASGP